MTFGRAVDADLLEVGPDEQEMLEVGARLQPEPKIPATLAWGSDSSRMPIADVAPTRSFCMTLSWMTASGSSVFRL